MEKELLQKALDSLRFCCADFDKIARTCDSKDVDLGHIQLMAENGRDWAGKAYESLFIMQNSLKDQAND